MESYQNRLATFKSWGKQLEPQKFEFFAVVGFFCTSNIQEDNTTCAFCSKSLEGWEATDVPVEEHYSHSTKCPLFNLNNYMARRRTFEASGLKNTVPGDTFCFRCGFNIDVYLCSDAVRRAESHHNTCPKRHLKNLSFDSGNPQGIFYIDLLKGRYNESITAYVDAESCCAETLLDAGLVEKLWGGMDGNPLVNMEDALLDSLQRMSHSLEAHINTDIRRALRNFEATVKKSRP
ncbi:UNVERIFIED_CONTAM: hypothetical protein PYX00_011744 [Menopon gallinae]|uniref:Uncharacterized protein n=1 Tax=Menopon gallinae TaxID=328185 RepID=A0AAW2H8D5_9NEOP